MTSVSFAICETTAIGHAGGALVFVNPNAERLIAAFIAECHAKWTSLRRQDERG